jgi:hypothetical protein
MLEQKGDIEMIKPFRMLWGLSLLSLTTSHSISSEALSCGEILNAELSPGNHTVSQNPFLETQKGSTNMGGSAHNIPGDDSLSLTENLDAYNIAVPLGLVLGLGWVLPKTYRYIQSARPSQGPQRGCSKLLRKMPFGLSWKQKNSLQRQQRMREHQKQLEQMFEKMQHNQLLFVQKQQNLRERQLEYQLHIGQLEARQQATETRLYELRLLLVPEADLRQQLSELRLKQSKFRKKMEIGGLSREEALQWHRQKQLIKRIGDDLRPLQELPKILVDLEQRKQALQAQWQAVQQQKNALIDQQLDESREMDALYKQMWEVQVGLSELQGPVAEG